MITLNDVETYDELRKLIYTHTFYLREGHVEAINDKTQAKVHLGTLDSPIDYTGPLRVLRDVEHDRSGNVKVTVRFRPANIVACRFIKVGNEYNLPLERMLVSPIEESFDWGRKITNELANITGHYLSDVEIADLPDYDPEDPSFTLDVLRRELNLGTVLIAYYRKEGAVGIKPIDYIFVYPTDEKKLGGRRLWI